MARPGATHASRLHGTVAVGSTPLPGIIVTPPTFTPPRPTRLAFTRSKASSPRPSTNVVVNARFTAGGFVTIDGAHASEVRDNVELVAGPDDWHGEDFSLPH